MKKVQKIVLLLGIIVSTIVPNQGHLTPQNTIIVFDLDAVLLTKPWWLKAQIIFDGIKLINPFTIASYFNALLAMKYLYMENSEGTKEILYDAHGNSLNGLTFHLLAYSIQDTRLAPYAASILQRIEASTCFIEGTRAIAQELKNKGFTIAFATNKDRVSYDIDAQALGNDLTGLADKVFVGTDVIHINVFFKNDDRTIYNMIYQDGLRGNVMMKRFAVTGITRDKEYNLTKGSAGTKVLYFTANPNGEAETLTIYLRPKPKLKKLAFDFDFS